MKVLYIGGTGEISYECVRLGVERGQDVTVFNRGQRGEPLPEGVRHITGDKSDDEAYFALADDGYDAVCQFIAFKPEDVERDRRAFAGKVGQYVFISSASAYQKPPAKPVITEETPLENPWWQYSRNKKACEEQLMASHESGELPVTIVRPSYTYRRKFTTGFGNGDEWAWRMLNDKPILSHGDGTSLWTVTHASDFAKPFVGLLGTPGALGEAFHITSDEVCTWDEIYRAIGAALGVEPRIVHVPTDTLLRYEERWTGSLLGDKAWSVIFDNTKVRSVAGDFDCMPMAAGMGKVAREHWPQRVESFQPNPELHALMDRIAADQEALGA